MAKLTREQLETLEAELPAIWENLAAWSESIMRSKRWIRGNIAPHGRQAGDLLQHGLTLVLSGKRTWPPSLSVLDLLIGTMKSDAWSWATGLGNREAGIDDTSADQRLGADDNRPVSTSPEGDTLSRDCFVKLRDRCIEHTSGDPDAEALVMAVLDGHETPAAVAAATGLTTAQISNAKRRLLRKMSEDQLLEEARS